MVTKLTRCNMKIRLQGVQTLIKLFQEWRGIEKIKGIKRQVSRTQSVDKMLQQPNSER